MAKNAQDFRKQKRLEKMMKGKSEGQLEYDKMVAKDTLELDIRGLDKEIKYKQNELDSGNITEKNENFIDGKKPRFLVEHEIDRLEMQKKHKQYILDKNKEEDNA